MKRFMILMVFIVIAACGQEEQNKSDANQDEIMVKEVSSVAIKAGTPNNAKKIPSDAIALSIESKNGVPNNEICLGVSVANFSKILSTQYTISWDPAILSFSQVQNFKLPQMTKQNFGFNHLEKGQLPSVWIDNSLSGITLSDGTKIYDICFIPKAGATGKSSSVQFSEEPTPFESVNLQEQVLKIITEAGTINVQ